MFSKCKIHDAEVNEETLIGVGPYGIIIELKWREASFAAKRLHDGVLLSENRKSLKRQLSNYVEDEVESYAGLQHPNIVQFIGTYFDPNSQKTLFVMEQMQLNLNELLETTVHNPDKLLPLECKLSIMRDVALGLNYLHNCCPIIKHQDLTSSNILISNSLEAKISDTHMAKIVYSRIDLKPLTQVPQKVVFMAPEMFLNLEGTDEKCDLFSYGVNCLIIFCHSTLKPGEVESMRDTGLLKTAILSSSSELIAACNDNLLPMVFKCLQPNPQDRPSATDMCRLLASICSLQQNRSGYSFLKYAQEMIKKDSEISRLEIQLQQRQDYIKGKEQTNKVLKEKLLNLAKILKKKENTVINLNQEVQRLASTAKSPSASQNLEKLRTCRKLWTKCAPLPCATIGGCTAVRNGKLFLCGGVTKNMNYLTHVYIYYPQNNKWYHITDCPQYYCSCAVINDHFTVIGGCNATDDTITNSLWSYNTTVKKWEQLLPSMPTKRSLTTSQLYDNRLIVCGGLLPDKTALDLVEVLDLATKKWSQVQSMPDKICRANSTICEDTMYVVGGIEDGQMATSKVYKVHLPSLLQSKAVTSPVWEFVRNTPSCHSAVVSLSGHIIVIGGQLKQRAISSSFLYNPMSNCWEFLGDMPVSQAHCRAILLDGKIIVMGGFTDGRDPTASSVVTVETLECIM